MKLLPTAFRIILNIFFYIVYLVLSFLLLGLILNKFMGISYSNGDPMSIKIGWAVIIFILMVTFIFKKFFYISLKNN